MITLQLPPVDARDRIVLMPIDMRAYIIIILVESVEKKRRSKQSPIKQEKRERKLFSSSKFVFTLDSFVVTIALKFLSAKFMFPTLEFYPHSPQSTFSIICDNFQLDYISSRGSLVFELPARLYFIEWGVWFLNFQLDHVTTFIEWEAWFLLIRTPWHSQQMAKKNVKEEF